MSRVLHRSLYAPPPTAVRGEGVHLYGEDGRRYLDASGGAAVSCLGHSHPRVIAAVIDQIQRLPSAHTSFFSNLPLEQLAEFLVSRAPAGIDRFLAVNEGSVAVECALKLARQYWVERGEPQRTHIIARRQSYHGNTLGALAVSGNLARRLAYAPMLFSGASHIAPCYEYRLCASEESAENYALRAADELESEIQRVGPSNVAAFIAETVVGATGGCVPPAPGYFARIREICDRHAVLFIADEIMCGMGRTGTLFACEQEGIVPDLITIAKGLGAGYQPIGGVLVHERITHVLQHGSGQLSNGHTYMGHAVACAAALAVQQVIEDENLLENVRTMGRMFEQGLKIKFGDHPHVGDIRGRGLFWAMELVADRKTKRSFDPALAMHARLKREAFTRGMLIYPSPGTADGVVGDHILFAPPYIIDETHVEQMVEITAASLQAALATS